MEQKNLSPSELCQLIDISEHDLTPEEGWSNALRKFIEESKGCSNAFATSLSKFITSKYEEMENTIQALKLDGGLHGSEQLGYLENVASNISGITSQQLRVI